jgi:hypothetical protein
MLDPTHSTFAQASINAARCTKTATKKWSLQNEAIVSTSVQEPRSSYFDKRLTPLLSSPSQISGGYLGFAWVGFLDFVSARFCSIELSALPILSNETQMANSPGKSVVHEFCFNLFFIIKLEGLRRLTGTSTSAILINTLILSRIVAHSRTGNSEGYLSVLKSLCFCCDAAECILFKSKRCPRRGCAVKIQASQFVRQDD